MTGRKKNYSAHLENQILDTGDCCRVDLKKIYKSRSRREKNVLKKEGIRRVGRNYGVGVTVEEVEAFDLG